MEILGIGPSELVFIVIIAIIVLGPRDMQKAGRSIGKWLRKVVTSDGWKLFQQTSREIQTLPNRLMREAALDELRQTQQELKQPLTVDSQAQSSPRHKAAERGAEAQPDRPDEPRILPPEPASEEPPTTDDPHA
jgi:sec-independent protein translocase protein TatB